MNSRTRGFTLIELLIAVAVIGILVPVMYSIMYEPLQRHTIESSREAQEADFDKVHRMLGRDIRSAARVVPSMDSISSGSSDLILEIPTTEEDSRIVPVRVHYRFASAAEEAAPLVREEYRKSEDGWALARTYPLSREVASMRFAGDAPEWKDTRLVTVAARWSGSAAHTALVHETTCLYALRGGRP